MRQKTPLSRRWRIFGRGRRHSSTSSERTRPCVFLPDCSDRHIREGLLVYSEHRANTYDAVLLRCYPGCIFSEHAITRLKERLPDGHGLAKGLVVRLILVRRQRPRPRRDRLSDRAACGVGARLASGRLNHAPPLRRGAKACDSMGSQKVVTLQCRIAQIVIAEI